MIAAQPAAESGRCAWRRHVSFSRRPISERSWRSFVIQNASLKPDTIAIAEATCKLFGTLFYGVPLFVEEMTKALMEVGGELEGVQTAAAVPSAALAVPASLHASLMARKAMLRPIPKHRSIKHGDRPITASQVLGTARRHQHGAVVEGSRQARRSP